MAQLYLPDPALDAQTDKRLKEILNLQWDLRTKTPSNIPIKYRYLINTAQMAGILAYRYMAGRDPYWLDLASGFADYVISLQWPNGNYDNYTSVAYPVKSVMTVMAAEKLASVTDERYEAAYDRHYASVKKAMDFLVRSQDNLTTEGENTFEDGMISCSGTQLAMFALLQQDPGERRRYAEASRKMLTSHRCLEQLLIPDSRMNGATLRFWEAQYDVLLGKSRNMMDSPHGWSAWLIPGLWFQYLLTGKEGWLRKTMNSMGSCAQLIDFQTGKLRWAFVPDPYREVTMLVPNPDNPTRGLRVDRIIGEEYVPMIASFHYPDQEPIRGNGATSGWTCCNDVHEVFTALAEVTLTSAFLIERANGDLVTWNCRAATNAEGTIAIQPFEDVVSRVHVNLQRPHQLTIAFANASPLRVKADEDAVDRPRRNARNSTVVTATLQCTPRSACRLHLEIVGMGTERTGILKKASMADHSGKHANRTADILRKLRQAGSVSVDTLSEEFGVSLTTIRRDLQELEEEGLLRRTHGGALPIEPLFYEPFRHDRSFQEQVGKFADEKRRIAMAAAEFVSAGDTVALTAGTTTTEVIRSLPGPERHYGDYKYCECRHGVERTKRH